MIMHTRTTFPLTQTYTVSSDHVSDSSSEVQRVSEKKTSTHIIGYKLRNSCPILIIFDTKIPDIT